MPISSINYSWQLDGVLKDMIRIVGYLFFSLFSLSVFPCEDINLQTKVNSPLHDIPVYSQNGLGACYAYAASQLVDYQRFKSNVKNKNTTHPIWILMSYIDSKWFKDDFTGGNIDTSINAILSSGVCDKPIVDKALAKYKNGNNITDAELMDLIEEIYRAWSKKENVTTNDVYNDAIKACSANSNNKIKNSMYDSIFSGFEKSNGSFSKVLPRVLLGDILADCKGAHVYKPLVKSPKVSCASCDDSGIDKKIAELLKADQPVGISYCASILGDKNYRGISASRNDKVRVLNRTMRVIAESDVKSGKKSTLEGGITQGCGRHASLIVGSRKRNNKCQYLLRNSWGSKSYEDFPDCVCETSKGKYVDCKHQDGKPNKVGCWIDRDSLTPNIYTLTHF